MLVSRTSMFDLRRACQQIELKKSTTNQKESAQLAGSSRGEA